MRSSRPGLMALAAALALVIAAAGCGSSSSIPDSKLISELELKKTARGYEIGGDPFCTVEQLLNTSDEVSNAADQASAARFVIPGPDGRVGVLAQRPFAPDCTRKAKRKLKQLERRSG
jgi:hypothetical protein